MINVKDQVYDKLTEIDGLSTENVSDVYPARWESFPQVEYQEEDNRVDTSTDDTEKMSYVRYCIHIWHNRSTSAFAVAVDAAMSALGLRRIQCSDADDPSGLRHKIMRFEGIIEDDSEIVYQTR